MEPRVLHLPALISPEAGTGLRRPAIRRASSSIAWPIAIRSGTTTPAIVGETGYRVDVVREQDTILQGGARQQIRVVEASDLKILYGHEIYGRWVRGGAGPSGSGL